MANAAQQDIFCLNAYFVLWQPLPVTAEKIALSATELSFPITKANKLMTTLLADQAIRLFISGTVPPDVAASVRTE